MDTRETEGLKSLGRKTEYRSDYAPEVLETFSNRHPENDYWVRFNCPEFTSLCPITGQPDFAEIRISYIPDEKMVESKSLKLYLFSYRNHGDFHEDCVNKIMKDLIRLMDPKSRGISPRVAGFPYILTQTTAGPARNTRLSPRSVWPATSDGAPAGFSWHVGVILGMIPEKSLYFTGAIPNFTGIGSHK